MSKQKVEEKRPEYKNKKFVKDLWRLYKDHKFAFVFYSILLSISHILELIPALYIAKIIDFFTAYSGGPLTQFYEYLGILFGLMVAATILRLKSKLRLNIMTSRAQKETSVRSFNKLMQGDLVWHDKENTGNKMEKINGGLNAMGSFMQIYNNQAIGSVVKVVSIVTIFGVLGLKYALIAIAFMAIYLIIEIFINRIISKKVMQLRLQKEMVLGKRFEFSSNINTVKSLGLEKPLNKEVNNQEIRLLDLRIDKRKTGNTKWIINQTLSAIFYAIFIFFVGRDIVAGLLTVGSIVIYIEYVRRLQGSLNTFSSQVERLIDVKFAIYRLMEIYDKIPDINEEGAKKLNGWKKIVAKDISFKYKKEGILKNFNLEINRGEKIGIVGRSGSGKSTLFKLFLKLYLPKKGMIFYDAKPITKLTRESIVNKYSIVPQESEVFNLSFKENILISSPARIRTRNYERALKVSQSIPIIKKMKDGDLSLIGEKGVRLSGGERQRLGIARAIYRDSDVMIFDESTSNLDYETEKKIMAAFDKELKDKTLIISAHRLSTLRNMDKVVLMEKGRIVESGTYNELLKKRGKFYKLWKKQEE